MNQELPAVHATIAPLDLYSALGEALRSDLNADPRRESVLCLQAHHGTENSNAAWNNNLCNIRRHGTVDYCTLPSCSEIEADGHEHFYTRDAAAQAALAARGKASTIVPQRCQFAAYATLQDGCRAYLALLQTTRYARSWAAMLSGDPAAFAHALHQDGWMTANEMRYTALLVSLYHSLDSTLPSI